MRYQFYDDIKYFITYSAENRGIFLRNDEKQIIKLQLQYAAMEWAVEVEAFAICHNHLHAMINEADQEKRKMFLKSLAGRSSRELNLLNGRTGTFWNSYHAKGIFTEKAYRNILGYILGNPIRHGLVHSFDELAGYEFSSFGTLNGNDMKVAEDLILSILKIKKTSDETAFVKELMAEESMFCR